MKYLIETKTSLREATPQECQMISWHIEVGEELYLYGMSIYQEDFTSLPHTTNSRWSKYPSFPKGWAPLGKERMVPSYLYDKYMEATPEKQELFMKWIHMEYDVPEDLAYHMNGMQEALWVLGLKH